MTSIMHPQSVLSTSDSDKQSLREELNKTPYMRKLAELVASLQSRGSLALKLGKFETAEEEHQRQKKILNHQT